MDSLITTSLIGTKLQMDAGDGRNGNYYCQQCVKHRTDFGFRKFSVLCKQSPGRQVRSSEMPYVSYPSRLYLLAANYDSAYNKMLNNAA
jgi:hypothetical protein